MDRKTLLILVVATVSAATGFEKYSNGDGKKTYFQAASACKDLGMTLAMDKTDRENVELLQRVNELIPEESYSETTSSAIYYYEIRRGWLGLDAIQGFLKWTDGSQYLNTLPFRLEYTGHPPAQSIKTGCYAFEFEHLVRVQELGPRFRDRLGTIRGRNLVSTNCDKKLPYICGNEGGTIPPATWSEWSYPEACSVTCGEGRTRRTRECRRGGLGAVADSECEGESTWELPCNISCGENPRPPSRTTCKKAVPGAYWTYFGYDITELDLLPWHQSASGPEGMKNKVVSTTCENPGHIQFNGGRYEYSDQITTVTPIFSGGCNEQSEQFNSTNEVSNKFSLNVGFEASYLSLFSFSASASYKKMSKIVKKKNKFFSELSCYYSHLKVNLQINNYLQLHPQAQHIVDKIHEPWNPKSYMHQHQWRLIDNFGTHYFDDAVLGGKYQLTNEIDSSFLSNHKKKDLDLAMKAQAEIRSFSAETKADAQTEDESLTEEFESKSHKYEQYFGGSIDLQTKESRENWKNSTYVVPWILSGNVKPIYDLIHDRVKKLWVKQAVEQHVFRRFVKYAKELNVPSNPEVQYMINSLSDKMLTLEDVTRLRNLLVS